LKRADVFAEEHNCFRPALISSTVLRLPFV